MLREIHRGRVELKQWVEGVDAFDAKDYERCLDLFMAIADTAKIHFNIAMAFINLGALDDAIAALGRSVACDPFLAVGYFMRGVCHYNANALDDSLADFNDALTYLRGNSQIDYAQLGLSFKLFSCEVSFNRGLCLAAMGQVDEAYKDFDDASRSRPPSSESTEDFRNIDEAMKLGDRAPEFLGPYAVAPDCVYRPPTGRVKNIDFKDYMGKAKVVASVEATDNYAGFSGRELKMKTLPRSNSTNDISAFPLPSLARSNTSTGVLSRSATVTAPGSSRLVGGGVAQPSLMRPLRNRSSSLGQNNDFRALPTRVPTLSVNPIDELMSDLGENDDNERGGGGTFSRNGSGYGRNGSYARGDDGDPGRDDRQDNGRENGRDNPRNYGRDMDNGRDNGRNNGREQYAPPTGPAYPSNRRPPVSRAQASSPVGSNTSTVADKIKLKAHYDTTRILLLPPVVQLSDLLNRLQDKFGLSSNQAFQLKYKDDDDELVTIVDQEDLEVAWAVQGVEWGEGGKVEVWCELL
ncbi:hypothetical protein HKX48_000232 [Thoreauomyces humboldtii]|nr:hypothetical protein HKX48_000232 [Thoreauomyces humboldtii]